MRIFNEIESCLWYDTDFSSHSCLQVCIGHVSRPISLWRWTSGTIFFLERRYTSCSWPEYGRPRRVSNRLVWWWHIDRGRDRYYVEFPQVRQGCKIDSTPYGLGMFCLSLGQSACQMRHFLQSPKIWEGVLLFVVLKCWVVVKCAQLCEKFSQIYSVFSFQVPTSGWCTVQDVGRRKCRLNVGIFNSLVFNAVLCWIILRNGRISMGTRPIPCLVVTFILEHSSKVGYSPLISWVDCFNARH